jgi:ABC-type siderophore export system fused ATPase/permease subunit
LYDPTEGTILLDGHDIKTFRMEDIRRAMATLFQDYTLFPLSVRLQRAIWLIPVFVDATSHRSGITSPSVILLAQTMTPQ